MPHTHIHTLQLLQHALFPAFSEGSYWVFFMVSGKIQEFKGEELELFDFKKICSGPRSWINTYLFMKINTLHVQHGFLNIFFSCLGKTIPDGIRKCKEVWRCYRLFKRYLVKAFQHRKALSLFSSYSTVSSSYGFALFGIDLIKK